VTAGADDVDALTRPAQDRLRIVSHYPGRLRVRAETFRVLPEVGAEVAQRIAEERGVTSAHASRVTGSLLVTYDPRELQLPRLIHMLVRIGGLHGIEVDAANDWQHRVDDGTRVREVFAKVNDTVRAVTSGTIDMKVAVPGTLAGTGLLMFLAGRRRVPEWYDLLFWAFVTFSNLNPRPGETVSPKTGGGGEDDGERAAR
jgi:hypothetical protein